MEGLFLLGLIVLAIFLAGIVAVIWAVIKIVNAIFFPAEKEVVRKPLAPHISPVKTPPQFSREERLRWVQLEVDAAFKQGRISKDAFAEMGNYLKQELSGAPLSESVKSTPTPLPLSAPVPAPLSGNEEKLPIPELLKENTAEEFVPVDWCLEKANTTPTKIPGPVLTAPPISVPKVIPVKTAEINRVRAPEEIRAAIAKLQKDSAPSGLLESPEKSIAKPVREVGIMGVRGVMEADTVSPILPVRGSSQQPTANS